MNAHKKFWVTILLLVITICGENGAAVAEEEQGLLGFAGDTLIEIKNGIVDAHEWATGKAIEAAEAINKYGNENIPGFPYTNPGLNIIRVFRHRMFP